MCGRYALYGPQSRLKEQFGVDPLPEDWGDHYNITPSLLAPVIHAGADGVRALLLARWGLLPSWVRQPMTMAPPINARLETAAERPMFRAAFRHRRIIVPASGFYEWQALADGKQPWFATPVGLPCFALAGLLEHHDTPQGRQWSYAILTTAANSAMSAIHERMPVILQPEAYAGWLDPAQTDAAAACALASPFPDAAMKLHRVGKRVGNPRAAGPELILPLAP